MSSGRICPSSRRIQFSRRQRDWSRRRKSDFSMSIFIAGNCFPSNLTLDFIVGRYALLSQVLSVGEFSPRPPVPRLGKPFLMSVGKRSKLAASVESVFVDVLVGLGKARACHRQTRDADRKKLNVPILCSPFARFHVLCPCLVRRLPPGFQASSSARPAGALRLSSLHPFSQRLRFPLVLL